MIPLTPITLIKNSLFASITYLVSLTIAYLCLFPFHFFYGVWHDYGGIGDAIEKYGPHNRYKAGFEHTDREQRLAIFADINYAVHSSGDGLRDISFTIEQSGQQTLLREPEVVHLQDVANLIDIMKIIAIVAVLLWCITVSFFHLRKLAPPSLGSQGAGLGIFIAVTMVFILVIGAETVFNQLHIWIFPKDHEWFFYYQDSLMSTLMFAPNLFAYIAIELVVFSIAIFFGLQILVRQGGVFFSRTKLEKSPPPMVSENIARSGKSRKSKKRNKPKKKR